MSGTTAPSGGAPASTPAAAAPAAAIAAPAVSQTPIASEPGPAVGTSPGESASASPASFSSETTAPAASETPAATPDGAPAKSVLSSLGDTSPGDKPAEPAAPVEAAAPAEPVAPPTYEAFKVPEGVQLDETKVGAFTGILGDLEARLTADPTQAHAVVQEVGQKMIDLYMNEAQAAKDHWVQAQTKAWDDLKAKWFKEYEADPVIGGNQRETSLQRMGKLLDMYAAPGTETRNKLGEAFDTTGAGFHPEVLRFVHWASKRLTETARIVPAQVPRAAPVRKGPGALYKNMGNGASA